MNYFKKHHSLSDVDVIRLLERIDRGASYEEIFETTVPEDREDVQEFFSLLQDLETMRTLIVPPHEILAPLLEKLDTPEHKTVATIKIINQQNSRTSNFLKDTLRNFSILQLRSPKFLVPFSVITIVAILFVRQQLSTVKEAEFQKAPDAFSFPGDTTQPLTSMETNISTDTAVLLPRDSASTTKPNGNE